MYGHCNIEDNGHTVFITLLQCWFAESNAGVTDVHAIGTEGSVYITHWEFERSISSVVSRAFMNPVFSRVCVDGRLSILKELAENVANEGRRAHEVPASVIDSFCLHVFVKFTRYSSERNKNIQVSLH